MCDQMWWEENTCRGTRLTKAPAAQHLVATSRSMDHFIQHLTSYSTYEIGGHTYPISSCPPCDRHEHSTKGSYQKTPSKVKMRLGL